MPAPRHPEPAPEREKPAPEPIRETEPDLPDVPDTPPVPEMPDVPVAPAAPRPGAFRASRTRPRAPRPRRGDGDGPPSLDQLDIRCTDPRARGLLCYKKWWFLREVGISVRGTLLFGTPIFLREDALRVVNARHSYIIPIRNVDYIQTPDGLDAACAHFESDTR